MTTETPSSFAKLYVLTPSLRPRWCESLIPAVSALQDDWAVTWYVSPNESGWDADLPPFARLLPIRFQGTRPLPRINQAREALRCIALGEPASVVIWLDDDMVVDAPLLGEIARLSADHGALVAPVMRNRHGDQHYTCAWLYQPEMRKSVGNREEIFIPHFVYAPSSAPAGYPRQVAVHGVGLGCTAHPWEFLGRLSFPATATPDDERMSLLYYYGNPSSIVLDYGLHARHRGAEGDGLADG